MVPPLVQIPLTKHSLLCTNIHSARYRAHPSDPTMLLQFRQQLRNVFCSVLLQTRTHRLLSVKRNLTYFFPSLPYNIYDSHHIKRFKEFQAPNSNTKLYPGIISSVTFPSTTGSSIPLTMSFTVFTPSTTFSVTLSA